MQTETEKKRHPLAEMLQKKNGLFLAGLVGICLIGLSEVLLSGTAAQPQTEAQTAAVGASTALTAYLEDLEERLTRTLECVEGAGQVQVMITLESSGQTIFALDEQSTANTQESDGEAQRQSTYQSEHILYDPGTGQTPLVEEQTEPEIRGVAVVCEGGGDVGVVNRITELVSVVLGLPSNRICVTKMI